VRPFFFRGSQFYEPQDPVGPSSTDARLPHGRPRRPEPVVDTSIAPTRPRDAQTRQHHDTPPGFVAHRTTRSLSGWPDHLAERLRKKEARTWMSRSSLPSCSPMVGGQGGGDLRQPGSRLETRFTAVLPGLAEPQWIPVCPLTIVPAVTFSPPPSWDRGHRGVDAVAAGKAGPGADALPAKAKRVIHSLPVRRSQSTRFVRYKPELEKRHGQPLDSDEKPDVVFRPGRPAAERTTGSSSSAQEPACGSPTCFPAYRRGGRRLTVIRSMVAESSSHTRHVSREQRLSLNGFLPWAPGFHTAWAARRTTCRRFVVLPDSRGLRPGTITGPMLLIGQHQGVAFQSAGRSSRPLPHAEIDPAAEARRTGSLRRN